MRDEPTLQSSPRTDRQVDRQPVRRAGREYLRVSLDRSGRARSVDEQHDDNVRDAEHEELGTSGR